MTGWKGNLKVSGNVDGTLVNDNRPVDSGISVICVLVLFDELKSFG